MVQNVQQTSSDDVQTDGFAAAAQAAAADGEIDPEVAAAGGTRAGQAADRSSRTSGRRPRATRRARAVSGKKFKMCHGATLSGADAAPIVMRDFTDDLRSCAAASARPTGYLKIDDNRARLTELEARGRPPRPVGRPGRGQEDQHRVRQRQDRRRPRSTRCRSELDDAEVLHELAREVDDESQEPEIDAAIAVDHAAARPARPAQPVHRRARRGRLHRADQRQGRRRRRPGLGRDAAADVRPLGRATRLRLRDRRRQRRRRGRASCRPSSPSPAATPTA